MVAPEDHLQKGAHEIWKQVVFWSFQHSIKNDLKKGNMKKFTIEVRHAAPGQLVAIAAELKIMSNGWTKYGPRIMINGQKLQAPSLTIPGSGRKRWPRNGKPQARHN